MTKAIKRCKVNYSGHLEFLSQLTRPYDNKNWPLHETHFKQSNVSWF